MLILLFVASRIWAANLESFFGIRKIPTAYLRTRRPARSGSDKAERPDRKNKYYDRKSYRCDRRNGDYTCFPCRDRKDRTVGMPARTDFGN